jgi:predicted deacylase
MQRGIPWLYVESPSGRCVSRVELPFYVRTLLNLLGYLEVIEREPPASVPKLHLFGSGDVDRTQSVNVSGFFVQRVKLLDQVKAGDLVGEVRDLFGEVLEDVRTLSAGIVAVLRSDPLVNPGDPVCLVSESLSD